MEEYDMDLYHLSFSVHIQKSLMTNNVINNVLFETFCLIYMHAQESPAISPYEIFVMPPFPTYCAKIIDTSVSWKQK